MNNKLLKYLALPSLLLVSACSTNNKGTQDPFKEQLAYNYKHYGDSLGNTYSIHSKKHFQSKGKKAARGYDVSPDGIAEIALRAGDDRSDLANAHALLEKELAARTMDPRRLADMQFYYDCWLDQETRMKGDVATCKEKFMELANGLKPQYADCKSTHNVYFPVNGHCLVNATDTETIRSFAEMAKSTNDRILVVGSADKSGCADYNKKLSLKRAKAVADQLVSYGISKDRIKLIALGESRATAEDEPESRSVGLFIENEELMKCFRTHGNNCGEHYKHHCHHKKHSCGKKHHHKKKVVKKKHCSE